MCNTEYLLFMAEAEGYLDTKESKIQKIIKATKDYPADVISELTFNSICEECGLPRNELTEKDMSRILWEING